MRPIKYSMLRLCKDINRIVENPLGSKYHMTFSLSENNALFIPTALKHGASIAVVTDIPTNKTKDRKAYKFNPRQNLQLRVSLFLLLTVTSTTLGS